ACPRGPSSAGCARGRARPTRRRAPRRPPSARCARTPPRSRHPWCRGRPLRPSSTHVPCAEVCHPPTVCPMSWVTRLEYVAIVREGLGISAPARLSALADHHPGVAVVLDLHRPATPPHAEPGLTRGQGP